MNQHQADVISEGSKYARLSGTSTLIVQELLRRELAGIDGPRQVELQTLIAGSSARVSTAITRLVERKIVAVVNRRVKIQPDPLEWLDSQGFTLFKSRSERRANFLKRCEQLKIQSAPPPQPTPSPQPGQPPAPRTQPAKPPAPPLTRQQEPKKPTTLGEDLADALSRLV